MELATMQRPSPLVPGYYLDRYELLCPIAEGGMASVWVARLQGKHGFEKLFAIKTILPEHAADARFQQMFLDEARIASRIEHPNVAQILDLGEQHDILYIVMEWVDGDSMSRLNRSAKRKNVTIPLPIVLRLVADACGGLHAAHELAGPDGKSLGVVHRDVSPQNILVSNRGMARLIDFGIAKARDRLGDETSAGMLKGKIHYMSPEQATGADVDRRADIFAAGAILYTLLAGKAPYDGKSQKEVLDRMNKKEPPPPLPPTVHSAVRAIVMRALAHDPKDRYPTAAALQAAIESAMTTAKLGCTTAEVARFANEHLAEHAQKRKEAIDLAISAAKERQRVRELLKPPMSEASMAGTAASSGAFSEVTSASSPGLGSSSGVVPAGSSGKQDAIDEPIAIELIEPSHAKRTAIIALACVALGALVAVFVVKSLKHDAPQRTEVVVAPPTVSTVIVIAAPPPTSTSAPTASEAAQSKPAQVGALTQPKPAATSTTGRRHRVNDGF